MKIVNVFNHYCDFLTTVILEVAIRDYDILNAKSVLNSLEKHGAAIAVTSFGYLRLEKITH